MPGSRLAKTMSEKKEVVTWIEEHREVPARALTHFQNKRGWKSLRLRSDIGGSRRSQSFNVPDDVVTRSVAAAGFAPCYQDWHISRHDVYGALFCRKWLSRDDDSDDNNVEEVSRKSGRVHDLGLRGFRLGNSLPPPNCVPCSE
ncbi:hypothetical protein ON010_g3135 [Phytophthora cinnamomi]|nr:hypothetical protein ON010_g3135 [Phytophthora cinnamomi]